MPCYNPLKGYFSKDVNPSGKRSITFNIKQAYDDKVVTLPWDRDWETSFEK